MGIVANLSMSTFAIIAISIEAPIPHVLDAFDLIFNASYGLSIPCKFATHCAIGFNCSRRGGNLAKTSSVVDDLV